MHNDKRNENLSPRVRRSPQSIAIASFVGLGSLIFAGVTGLWHSFTLSELAAGTVTANIPIQPETADAAVATWTAVDAVSSSTSFIEATIKGLPTDVIDHFVIADVAALLVAVLTVLPIIAACVGVIIGRLRWRALAGLIRAAGIVIVIGSVIVENTSSQAAVSASAAVYADEDFWWEPGFLVGIDPLPVIAGFLVIFTSLALARLSRFATDADGVV